MSSDNLSLKAGTVCATCNNPDPCLHTITVDGFDKKTHIWPEEKQIHLTLLDDGKGCDGTIKIESKCGKPDCPQGTLEHENDIVTLQNGVPTPATVYFKKPTDIYAPPLEIEPLWEYLDNIALPTDMFSDPKRYNVITQGCYECANYVVMDVYPTVEFQAGVGFSYEEKGRERTWKERTSERIAARKNMKNTLPKNKNNLRNGWTIHTDQFEIAQEYKIDADFQLSVGGFEYSKEVAYATKKVKTFKLIDQISKIKKIISNIGNNFLEDKSSKTPIRKFLPLEVNFAPIQIGLAYAYQRTETIKDAAHYMGFVAAPLLKTDLKINILPLIALISRNPKTIERCRTLINSGSVDFYLLLGLDLSVSIGATYQNQAWEFFEPSGETFTGNVNSGEGSKLQGTIESKLNVHYNKEVAWSKVSFKFQADASGNVLTTFGIALDHHEKGLDLVCYHDGVVIEFGFTSEFNFEINLERQPTSFDKKGSFNEKIVLGKPIKVDSSSMRVSIFGETRAINEKRV